MQCQSELKHAREFTLGIFLLITAGCASPRVLAPPPNIYSADNPYPDHAIPDRLRVNKADILFATDRVWDHNAGAFVPERSPKLSIGQMVVKIGGGAEWNDLMDIAEGVSAPGEGLGLVLGEIRKEIEFPATPIQYRLEAGVVVEQEDIIEIYDASINAFQEMVRQRLLIDNTDTVLIYVHGFNIGLDEAAFALTDIWHYSGRGSVPIVFSWPAREGNVLSYFSARESGEFSIFHLKEVLRALQGISELSAINILAHSRGVDVTTAAIRELIIEARGASLPLRNALKIENLILAAADIDVAVAGQRLGAERFALAVGQITIYSNPDDTALRLSSLVSSGLRVGRSNSQVFEDRFSETFLGLDNIAFVDVSGVPGDLGHNYYRLNPSVIGDIAIMLQTDARPRDPARSLRPVGGNFYELVQP